MIGIQLDGENDFLETNRDTSIQMRLQNPLLGDAEKLSPGSFSFPFDLPSGDVSPINSAKLKHPDVIENNEAYQVQKATVFFDGIPFKRGNLKTNTVDRNKASCYFSFGLNSISPDFKTAKLRDVLNEEIVISSAPINKIIYLKALQTITTIDITVNEKSYSGTNAEVVSAINTAADQQKDTNKFVPKAQLITSGSSPSGLITAPFIKFYLVKVVTVGVTLTYVDSVDPLDVLSVKINPLEAPEAELIEKREKNVNQNDYIIESFDMTAYYNAFSTFFSGYISGAYPTNKFRIPAFINEDPYAEDDSFVVIGQRIRSSTGVVTYLPSFFFKEGNLNNGVNAAGLIRNTFNHIIDFLLTVNNWNSGTAYTRFQSHVKYADTNGDIRYWRCLTSNTNQPPPSNPTHTFDSYWVQIPLDYHLMRTNNNSLQPFLKRKYILEKIATTFGFDLEGDFYDHPDLEEMLEYTTASLDSVQDYIGDKQYVFWKRSFNLNELVPDITVVEYLKRLQNRYNLGIYFNETTKKIRLKFRESVIKSYVYDDITSLASPFNLVEEQRITGYSINCPKDDNDQYSQAESLTVGTAEQRIDMLIGGISSMGVQLVDGNNVTAPRVKQKFGSPFLMRTFYYKGLNTSGSFSYPSADIKGTSINESLSTVGAAIGIYDNFYKYWLNAKKNWRLIKINVSFPFRMITNFDWELKRRYDRSNFIISSMDVKMNNKGVQVTSVEILTTI